MIDGDFKPGFKLSLHHKDLKIAKSFLTNIGIQLKSLKKEQRCFAFDRKRFVSTDF